MKSLLLAVSLLLSTVAFSQRAKISNDTVYYATDTLYKGSKVQLMYGSSSNKDFAFLYIGTALTGITPVQAGWAKSAAVVDKVYKQGGKTFARAKLTEAGPMMGNKIFIDIEGAIDNKEIKTHVD